MLWIIIAIFVLSYFGVIAGLGVTGTLSKARFIVASSITTICAFVALAVLRGEGAQGIAISVIFAGIVIAPMILAVDRSMED